MSINKIASVAALSLIAFGAGAQVNLVNSLNGNQTDNSKEGFKFTEEIRLPATPVKNQGSSGTCWSYSGNSFLESEMMRNGKEPVELAQIYTARCAYVEKGMNYVRMHGAVSLGDGGEFHDVINMYRKYGALPQSVYTGLNYGTTINKFDEMASIQQAILGAVVKNPNGSLTPNWLAAYTGAIDAYLGKVPENFVYKGKTYTPQTFAKEVVGLNADDYVEFSSDLSQPLYRRYTLMVPDNWAFDQVYNVQMNDITDMIDYALKNKYTVAWATDVSEKSFSWKNGVAYIPDVAAENMTADQQKAMFAGPKPELNVTPELRQKAYDNYQTTDDHGMHIIGLAKDQNGKEYYIVKNSWGEGNDYKGFLYVTKDFVKYKTTAFMLNKNGISADMKKKINL